MARRFALLPALGLVACTASMRPGAKTSEAAPPPDVADEFAFVVNPLAHAAPAGAMDAGGGAAQAQPTYRELPRRETLSSAPRMEGVERATSVATPLEYAAIPLMESTPSAASAFTLTKKHVSPQCPAGHTGRERDEWWMSGNVAVKSIVRVDGVLLPPVARLSRGRFEDFGGEIARLAEPRIWAAEWTTVELPVVGPTMAVTTFDGRFDTSTMTASAKRASTVEAIELVPGEVWVFRRCEAACHLPVGDTARVEELSIVGPPAAWIGSAGPTAEVKLDVDQPFTLLSTRVFSGSSGSMVLDYTVESAKQAQREAVSKVDAIANTLLTVSVMVDVVWPVGDRTPTVTLYRGEYGKRIADAYPRTEYDAGDGDCYGRPIPYPDPAFFIDYQ